MTAPTPETHRYVGMWRPPFESLWLYQRKLYRLDEITCPCGAQLPNPQSYSVGATPKILRDHAWAHWFGGHFDEPQYEAKTWAETRPECEGFSQ